MRYENPDIPEGINSGKESPLKELALLGIVLIGGFVAIIYTLSLVAESVAETIPFEYERDLIAHLPVPESSNPGVEEYLQVLADELANAQALPNEMTIKVHYVESDVVNAFATFGGHIVIFRGLLNEIPNENALAMVLSHEIAHIKLRHPILSLGRAMVISVAMAAVSGVSGNQLADYIFGNAGLLTSLSFSRNQEEAADEIAIMAVAAIYGHVSGAEDLYTIFLERENKEPLQAPTFLSTHPDTAGRIDRINEMAKLYDWSLNKPTRPLSEIASM